MTQFPKEDLDQLEQKKFELESRIRNEPDLYAAFTLGRQIEREDRRDAEAEIRAQVRAEVIEKLRSDADCISHERLCGRNASSDRCDDLRELADELENYWKKASK